MQNAKWLPGSGENEFPPWPTIETPIKCKLICSFTLSQQRELPHMNSIHCGWLVSFQKKFKFKLKWSKEFAGCEDKYICPI